MDDPGGASATVADESERCNTTLPIRANGRGTYLDLPGVLFDDARLTLPDDLTFERWERLGGFLLTLERNAQWWVADWLRFGERQYGERYSQAVQTATGYAASTLANFCYVARAIPPSRRRERLDFSHHAAVASLPPDEQDELLDRAEREHLPVRALYDEVRTRRGEVPIPTLTEAAEGDASPVSHEHEYVCRTCGEAKS